MGWPKGKPKPPGVMERMRELARESKRKRVSEFAERNALIVALATEGMMHSEIGRAFNLTRERVRQIVLRQSGMTGRQGEAMRRVPRLQAMAEAKAAEREAKRLGLVQRLRPFVELRCKGWTLKAIGDRLGGSESDVHRKMYRALRMPEFRDLPLLGWVERERRMPRQRRRDDIAAPV